MKFIFGFVLSILILVSSVTVGAETVCLSVYEKVRINLNLIKNPVQIFSRDKYDFKLIEISEVDKNSIEYKMAMDYLYNEYFKSVIVLQKDPSFLEKIKAANDLFLNQIHLLLMFDQKDPLKVIGGAAFVVVNNKVDLLPLQIELNLSAIDGVLENVFPKVEIARVSIDPQALDFSKNFRKLIETIIEVASESSDIEYFYVYTSRFHKRLYSQFGFQGDLIADHFSHPKLEKNDIIAKVKLPKK